MKHFWTEQELVEHFAISSEEHKLFANKAVRTIFLCDYLRMKELRRDIHEGLNVIELWNGVNGFILFGKGGEFATNRKKSQELTMLSLHLLQNCMVYINTLMIQQVLNDPELMKANG